MKLSEAIMLGSSLIRSVPFIRDDGFGGGCAMGMAEVAAGMFSFKLETKYPWMQTQICLVPCGHDIGAKYNRIPGYKTPHTPTFIIAHLFNEHVHGDRSWTLEQLVDWVRSVEPDEEPEATTETIAEWKQELVEVST